MEETIVIIFINPLNIVTKITVRGTSREDTPFLKNELSRCCGHNITYLEQKGSIFCFKPCGNIVISDKIATKHFLSEVTGDFFDAIHIKPDVNAYKTWILIGALRKTSILRPTVTKQKITDMINYLDLEGWDGTCDNDRCDNKVSIANVIKNLSLECPACLQK